MPRPSKGPRLYLHPDERVWLIRDGSVTRRTGCGEGDRLRAEERLGAYISEKFTPVARESDLDRITVAEVLTAYGREHAPNTRGKTAVTIGYNIAALLPFWGIKRLSDVRGATCRAYADQRRKAGVGDATIRRELSVLSSGIGHWHGEHGPLNSVPVVSMPDKPANRDRWLQRHEAAYLVAGALGFYRVFWTDVATRKRHFEWRRHPWVINRHAARFILLGLYTGTRPGAIAATQWMANTVGGWVDLDMSIMHRRGQVETETRKKRPPVRLGRRIRAHLRRWKRIDDEARAKASEEAGESVATHLHVVTYLGRPVQKIRSAWETAIDLAWLDDKVTPHTLRHTRATWVMQAGVDLWEASGSLGMSPKTLTEVYGHHHPDWQKKAAEV